MQRSYVRGVFGSKDEELDTFRDGVPTFGTVDECMSWMEKEGKFGSNPKDPNLRHIFTHMFDWKQISDLVVPRIVKAHEEADFSADDIDLSQNRFMDCDPLLKPVKDRLGALHHQQLSIESTMNTLEYLFFHLRCGIFVSIRNGDVAMFVPFVNKDYTNNWSKHFKTEYNNLDHYYKEKRNHYRREGILDMEQWWANGNIICNEHKHPKAPFTQWWGDNMIASYKHMLETLCKERDVPDVDFFFNKRDYPQLKMNLTEPYDFVFDQRDVPLGRCKFNTYAPILSFYCSPRFSDLPSPTTEDWEGSVGRVFPPSFIPDRGQLKTPRDLFLEENFRKFAIDWKEKVNTAFFRGSATGGGTTPDTNQRLKVALLYHEWETSGTNATEADGAPLLDAGVTSYNVRDKKLMGKPMTFLRKQSLPFEKRPFVKMYEQGRFKYILYIEGHCAANRYSFLMRLGSVILKVESQCEASDLWFFPLLQPYCGTARRNMPVGDADHIPVKADLSDLREKIMWCRDNDDKCKTIARNAQTLYATYLSREGVLDYLQMTMVEIGKRYRRPPAWWKRPMEPSEPVHSQIPPKACAFDRDSHKEVTCKRCRDTAMPPQLGPPSSFQAGDNRQRRGHFQDGRKFQRMNQQRHGNNYNAHRRNQGHGPQQQQQHFRHQHPQQQQPYGHQPRHPPHGGPRHHGHPGQQQHHHGHQQHHHGHQQHHHGHQQFHGHQHGYR